nr:unnamed protein product [Digitaria exilis]
MTWHAFPHGTSTLQILTSPSNAPLQTSAAEPPPTPPPSRPYTNAKLLTGAAWPSRTAKQVYPVLPAPLLHTLTVLSAEPLHTTSPSAARHRIAFLCPLSVPVASILPSPAPSPPSPARSHTTTDRASAFTADLCRSIVCTSTCLLLLFLFLRSVSRLHALILLSAEPVYTWPSWDTATALMASSCAFGTDSTHRNAEERAVRGHGERGDRVHVVHPGAPRVPPDLHVAPWEHERPHPVNAGREDGAQNEALVGPLVAVPEASGGATPCPDLAVLVAAEEETTGTAGEKTLDGAV